MTVIIIIWMVGNSIFIFPIPFGTIFCFGRGKREGGKKYIKWFGSVLFGFNSYIYHHCNAGFIGLEIKFWASFYFISPPIPFHSLAQCVFISANLRAKKSFFPFFPILVYVGLPGCRIPGVRAQHSINIKFKTFIQTVSLVHPNQ